MEITKKCNVCGNDFAAKSDKAQFCSNACRTKAHRNKEKRDYSNTQTYQNNNLQNMDWKYHFMMNAFREDFTKLSNDFYNSLPLITSVKSLKSTVVDLFSNDVINTKKISELEQKIENLEFKLNKITKFLNRNKKAKN